MRVLKGPKTRRGGGGKASNIPPLVCLGLKLGLLSFKVLQPKPRFESRSKLRSKLGSKSRS